jgi:exopolyphosphatase / guanosine-5'-triphosphate,3'-diphosphate pyrophosphatase
MTVVRRAVIDVGTNSVKLLVAEVSGPEVRPLLEQSRQTRLGSGFYESRRLQLEPIARTAAAVARFAEQARAGQAASIRIIATSAARDAVNAAELLSAIKQACGLPVEIISGDQEAEWAFQGAALDPELATATVLLLDVGGGSTQFILGHDGHPHFRASFSLGSVRLMETLPRGDPPSPADLAACRDWVRDFLLREVRPQIAPALQAETSLRPVPGGVQLVGTGGTATILACMEAQLQTFDRPRIEATRLSRERVRWHRQHLWRLSLAERQRIVGLPPKRADVILTGVAIYDAVMEDFGFSGLRVSTRGLRFAAVRDAA